jgi:DNA-binding NarL/FixJ family response regulator
MKKPAPQPSGVKSLSRRERDIAELIWATEALDKQICAELKISMGTLRTHLARIFKKLAVRTRSGVSREWERAARERIEHQQE